MSLKTRFSLVISGLVLFVVSATTGILYWTERGFLLSEVQEHEEEIVHSLAQVAVESHLSQDDLMLINFTAALPQRSPELAFAYVAAPGGKGDLVLAHTRRDLSGTPAAGLPRPEGGVRVVRRAIDARGQPIGEAVAGFSEARAMDSVGRALGRTRQRILAVTMLMTLVGLAASVLLAVSLTRPISRLADAASSLGQGKLGTRIPAPGAGELGQLSREFNEMAAKLEQLDEMKRDFVSSVTHELKSPLAAIDSYLSLILHESKAPRDVSRWVEDISFIRGHTARLSRFVTDLLDLAKIEKGAFTLQKGSVELRPLADEVLRLLSPLAESNRVALDASELSRELPRVLADPERVRQVLTNLVSNALKFTPAGGRVSLTAEAAAVLTIRVSDNGIGIAAKDLARLFQKFEQVKEARGAARGPKGTGLGLAICRAIVEGHGGRIWAESEPGRGSSFCFTLPLAEARVAAEARK